MAKPIEARPAANTPYGSSGDELILDLSKVMLGSTNRAGSNSISAGRGVDRAFGGADNDKVFGVEGLIIFSAINLAWRMTTERC